MEYLGRFAYCSLRATGKTGCGTGDSADKVYLAVEQINGIFYK